MITFFTQLQFECETLQELEKLEQFLDKYHVDYYDRVITSKRYYILKTTSYVSNKCLKELKKLAKEAY